MKKIFIKIIMIMLLIITPAMATNTYNDDVSIVGYLKGMYNNSCQYDYCISKIGNVISAINGTNGKIDFSGTNASQIFNQVDTALWGTGNGGTIFTKNGVYLIDSPIVLSANSISLKGENWQRTILKANSSISSIISKDENGPHRITIEDIFFDGNSLSQNGVNLSVYPEGSINHRINRVDIENVLDYAIIVDGAEDSWIDNSILSNNNKSVRCNNPAGNCVIKNSILSTTPINATGIQLNAQQCILDSDIIYSKIESNCQILDVDRAYFGDSSPSSIKNRIEVSNGKGALGSDVYISNTFLALHEDGALLNIINNVTLVHVFNLKTDVAVTNYYVMNITNSSTVTNVLLESIHDTVTSSGLKMKDNNGNISHYIKINFGTTANALLDVDGITFGFDASKSTAIKLNSIGGTYPGSLVEFQRDGTRTGSYSTAANSGAATLIDYTSNLYFRSILDGYSANASLDVNGNFVGNNLVDTINYIVDGAGVTPATGNQSGEIEIPNSCTITSAKIKSDITGSINITIYKAAYGQNFAPIGTIVLSSNKWTTSSLSGWTTTISKGDWLQYVINSVDTLTSATVSITCKR